MFGRSRLVKKGEETFVNTHKPAFDFYEIVTVARVDANTSEIRGERGFIAGRAPDERGLWGYAVFIYGRRECWAVCEKALESTGEFDGNLGAIHVSGVP